MAILSINEAPQPESTPAPEPEDQSTIKMCNELLSRFKKARQRWDTVWQSNYEFVFGGKQWTIDRPAWRFSDVDNFIWANIMTEVGIQTDARPRVQYNATEPSDFQFAKQLEKINEVNWQKYPWLQRVADILTYCKYVHVAHAEVCWNPELEDGLGDLELKLLNPFYFYWDPYATDVDEARAYIDCSPVPTSKLKREHPDKADVIKADIETVGNKTSDVVSTTSDRAIQGQTNVRAFRGFDQYGGEPMTFLERYWIKDDSVYEEEEEKNGVKSYVTKKKYPKGRYIEKCNNVILFDGPNGVRIGDKIVPYEDGKFPIARLVNYSYPGEYAGENEVTHCRGPQKRINYFNSHMADQMKMAGNPKVVIGSASGVDPDNVTNEPGVKILAADVNQVQFHAGEGLAPGMDLIITEAKKNFDELYGLTQVMKGAVDPSITSGLMFDGVVEAAQIRPRLKNRNLDQFLQRIGQLMLSRYLQFYTAPRVFRITNEQGYPEYVEFFVTQDEVGNKVANVTKTQINTDTGQVGAPMTAQMPVKGVPDVEVVSGSSLPFAKALKSKTALEYFNAGVIDQEEVLKAVDWPNARQVLERMQQAAATAQQQAEAQAAIGKAA